MFTQDSIIDLVSVQSDGQILVRRSDRVLRDGQVISATYFRHVVAPGQDLTGQDARVVAIANSVWTPEIIAAYQAATAAGV